MRLTYIIGGAGSGKSYQAYRRIIEHSIAEPTRQFFIIVPDQFTMQTQRDLVAMHPKKGIMNIDVLSFGRLAHRILDNEGNQRAVLDDTGKSLILRLVAGRIADELPMLGGNLQKQGYIHEMKSAISEFMQYGITPERLGAMTEQITGRKTLRGKMQDLSVVYREFLTFIHQKYITTEETMQVLAQRIPQVDFLRDSEIVLDGFTGFTPVQYAVIKELLSCARELTVTILNGAENNPYVRGDESDLFYLSAKTIADLNRIAEEIGAKRDVSLDMILPADPVYRHRNHPAMAALERDLFRRQAETGRQAERAECIHICQAANPREEMQYVADRIRELVTERGFCYRDIAVLTGDMSTYGMLVEECFEALEIPCFLDQTNPITQNPCTEFIRNGLQVVLQRFSYESVFQFLRSGFIGFEKDEIDRLENYCLAQGIRGRKRFAEPFLRYSRQIKDQVEELQALNEIRQRFMGMMAPLLTKCATMGEFVRALYDFLRGAKLEQRLQELAQRFHEKEDYVHEREYRQIYKLVMGLLEQLYDLLADEPISLQEFADIVDSGLNELEIGMIPLSVDRVVVGDLERTRLKDVRVLFCVGMNDGIVPGNSSKGGIISDLDRDLLAGQGWELAPGPRQKMFIQRLYLYMNVTRPTEELWLSYASIDHEGNSQRKSYFIDVIRKTCPGCSLHTAVTGTLDSVATSGQGQTLIAKMIRDLRTQEDEGREKAAAEFMTLYRILEEQMDDSERATLERIVATSGQNRMSARLNRAVADILYGQTLYNSVTRLESFVECAFQHFLNYGLHLQEQEQFEYDARDLGTMYHAVLERFGRELEKSEYDWENFPEEFARRIVREAVETAAGEYSNAIFYSSERNKYVLNRMERVMMRTVLSLKNHLLRSRFRPSQFELSFSEIEDLDSVSVRLSNAEKMVLKGSIDRLDTYVTDDKVYLKIMDYKSSKKEFRLVSVYYGLSLQMVVYLNAAMEYARGKYPGHEAVPAALLYYAIQDPLVDRTEENMPEEEFDRKLREKLKMTGVVNADSEIQEWLDCGVAEKMTDLPLAYKQNGEYKAESRQMSSDQFRIVSDYVNVKIRELGDRIMSGEIAILPHAGDGWSKSACERCDFRASCSFDPRDKDCHTWTEADMKEEECLAMMDKIVKGED